MKVLAVVLLFLVGAQGKYFPFNGITIPPSDQCDRPNQPGLGGELQDFIALIPFEPIIDEFFNAILFDPEVLEFINYIASDEFEQVVGFLRYNKAFIDLLEYLCEELHLDAYFYLNALGELLGVKPITRPPRRTDSTYDLGGVRGLVFRIYDLIPSDEMLDLWIEKTNDSDSYMCRFYRQLGSPEFVEMTEKMENDPAFIAFTEELLRFNFDTNIMIDWLKGFLWERDYCQI